MKNYLLSGESRNCTFMRTVKRRAVILVFALLASTQLLLAQQITGVVTDADSQALPGVNIVIKGTTNGTVTDFDGKYSIAAKAGDILVFQFIGYNAKDVTVADSKVINVALDLNTSTLDEVVVVGYGSVKKSLVTGAISSVKAEDLENSGNSRIEQAMQGRTAGVTVTSTSGSPGAGAKVRIRGTGSNSSSEPLYIVDGMKTGGIDNIDPNDIASMEILKDAASSAIYGTEGANGVVIITESTLKTASRYSFENRFYAAVLHQPANIELSWALFPK